jgi:hypothetical protein
LCLRGGKSKIQGGFRGGQTIFQGDYTCQYDE